MLLHADVHLAKLLRLLLLLLLLLHLLVHLLLQVLHLRLLFFTHHMLLLRLSTRLISRACCLPRRIPTTHLQVSVAMDHARYATTSTSSNQFISNRAFK